VFQLQLKIKLVNYAVYIFYGFIITENDTKIWNIFFNVLFT